MKPVVGSRISFTYKEQALIATVLGEEHGKLVLKLDSGYNITVPVDELKDVTEAAKPKRQPKPVVQEQTVSSGTTKITILHTGGTIASKVDYETGAVVAKFTAEEIVGLFPELNEIGTISSKLIRNMQSDDMRFDHYNLIADAVKAAIDQGAEGVIVTHGTDTLHYTAAALGFMLENVPVPIVLVGSQRSSDRGSSDAATNLVAAAQFITTKTAGVFVCMHATSSDDEFTIINGFNARKMHSSRRDAFRSVNAPRFATVGEDVPAVQHNGKFTVTHFDPKLKIGMLYIHPNLHADEVERFKAYDGLIILGTGLGHAPITAVDEFCDEHPKIFTAIAELAKRVPVVMTSQTIYGRVNMEVYSPGRRLRDAGVLGQNCDLTPETAFIKLAWLLSTKSPKETRELYGQNLRGELSERSDERGFEE